LSEIFDSLDRDDDLPVGLREPRRRTQTIVLKGDRRGGYSCCSIGLDPGPDFREFKRTRCWFGWGTLIPTIYAASFCRPQR